MAFIIIADDPLSSYSSIDFISWTSLLGFHVHFSHVFLYCPLLFSETSPGLDYPSFCLGSLSARWFLDRIRCLLWVSLELLIFVVRNYIVITYELICVASFCDAVNFHNFDRSDHTHLPFILSHCYQLDGASRSKLIL